MNSGSLSRVEDQVGLPLRLIERLTEGVAVVDHQGQYLILNGAAVEFFGFAEATRSLEESRTGAFVYREDQSDPLELDEQPLSRVLAGGLAVSDILRVENSDDGSTRWISAECFPLCNGDAGLIGAAAIYTDITQQRREERLLQKSGGSSGGLSTLNTISRDLAHELNQPLTTISLYARGCIRRVEGGWREEDEMLEALDAINAQALRAGELIRRAREISPWGPLQTTRANLNTLLGEMSNSARSRARDAGCSFELRMEADLPDCDIDPNRLNHLIWRLTELGIEATRSASAPRVVVWATHARIDAVELRIAGTTAHVSTSAESSLGAKMTDGALCLTVCRRIAEEHGGRIEFGSDEEGGIHAQFLLPISKEVSGDGTRDE